MTACGYLAFFEERGFSQEKEKLRRGDPLLVVGVVGAAWTDEAADDTAADWPRVVLFLVCLLLCANDVVNVSPDPLQNDHQGQEVEEEGEGLLGADSILLTEFLHLGV